MEPGGEETHRRKVFERAHDPTLPSPAAPLRARLGLLALELATQLAACVTVERLEQLGVGAKLAVGHVDEAVALRLGGACSDTVERGLVGVRVPLEHLLLEPGTLRVALGLGGATGQPAVDALLRPEVHIDGVADDQHGCRARGEGEGGSDEGQL